MNQYDLPDSIQRDLKYGSHIPLNTSMLKWFPVTGVLELGAGMNSTPMFFKEVDTVTSIENDKNWIKKLRNSNVLKEDETHKIIHHSLPGWVKRGMRKAEIPQEMKDESIEFFESHITEGMNLLFVDNYAGFRLESLQKLYKRFDIILYHDAELSCDSSYGYSEFSPDSNKYYHFRDETFLANTGFLIKKGSQYSISDFVNILEEESKRYADKFNVSCKMNIVGL